MSELLYVKILLLLSGICSHHIFEILFDCTKLSIVRSVHQSGWKKCWLRRCAAPCHFEDVSFYEYIYARKSKYSIT